MHACLAEKFNTIQHVNKKSMLLNVDIIGFLRKQEIH